jgi:hypothetical protein
MLGPATTLHSYAEAGADQVNVHHRDITPELVQQAHALCLAVSTYVVNDRATMWRMIEAQVDAISTDRPAMLARVLHGWQPAPRAIVAGDAMTPPAEPVDSRMTVRIPSVAVLRSRVPVRVKVRGVDGTLARFTWVRVQLRTSDGWVTLQRRVTNRYGNLSTSVTARWNSRLRILSGATNFHRAAPPAKRTIDVRRA